jgi:ElaB/YqjD/DUF883 family membrane-anchored ribosome-binding protein
MQNGYDKEKQSKNLGQGNGGYGRTSVIEGNEQQVKDMADNAQQQINEGIKQGQEKASQLISTVDKQLSENPWPIVAGVALGAFLLGTLIGKSRQ